ncbi:TadE/TadG family type IV pilus assembly protein [Aurantimonas sp. VKM B-3413]|uniref:TadE/TadG family type IV pilus assembly protein n=1 Tax=Aurantimonas sp. VKM B-3413 TaxID=2779401 RepID=UPI001E5D9472|nr:TadE/TadG family type IV pilus assembly protein [Aurantimonas sp. VKM B-3413]MCB8839674.1 pilus assembly protein [Aurantimonas sp. VKM B-3413]
MAQSFWSFWRCRRGNFAIITALASPVLLLGMGGVVNYSLAFSARSDLQAAADAAALGAARELYLANTKPELLQQAVEAMVGANLGADADSVQTRVSLGNPSEGTAANVRVLSQVTVTLSKKIDAALPMPLFAEKFGDLAVTAVARVAGGGRICMIALAEDGNKVVNMSGNAKILAESCAVYSDSVAKSGVAVSQRAYLSSELTCSAGGYTGSELNYDPLPLTDCPAVKDPLVSRVAAVPSRCDYDKLSIKGENKDLYGGVFCGDTKITGGSHVVMRPGTYVFWDGKLRVDQKSTLTGDGVSLVFLGKKAGLEIKNDTEIALSASQSGAMAGILLYADRDSNKTRKFKIESSNARKMVGTIYLPNDKLTIGGDKDGDGTCDPDPLTGVTEGLLGCKAEVGDYSEWTAIVADQVEVTSGAKLVLNTDYDGSTVPVPAGIGPVGRNIALVK